MSNRLVDKAEVLETYAELFEIFDDNGAIQRKLYKIYDKINDLPYVDSSAEVKAIPVEWVNKWLIRLLENNNYTDYRAVVDMLENWENK